MGASETRGLESYFADKLGVTDLAILSEWRNTEGWSMDTFSVALEYSRNGSRTQHDIIIRREPVGGLVEPYDISVEYKVLRALQDTPVAVPETYWYEPNPEIFERPFYAMEKVAGHVHFVSMRLDPNFRLIPDDAERTRLGEDFIDNLVAIHTTDWKAKGLEFLGDPGPGKAAAYKVVDFWAQVIHDAGVRRKPIVSLAYNWLMANAPATDRVCVVHGDYRTGNYISRDGRIQAVLDWEMVHLGDPHEDLAYVMSTAWRSPKPTSWISHLLPEDEFRAKYEERSGAKINEAALKYYGVYTNFKAVGIAASAANAFAKKAVRDIRPGTFGATLPIHMFMLARALQKRMGG